MMIIRVLLSLFCLISATVGAQDTLRLDLDQCVEIALKNNPQMLQSEFYRKMSDKDVTIALSNFLPSVNAGLGYNHSTVGPSSQLRIDPRSGIPVPVQPSEIKSWSSSADASVSQTVFSGGYNYYNYTQARNLSKSAEFDLEATKQLIIYMVKERYYNLLKQEQLLQVQMKGLESAKESLRLSQTLFNVGKASKSDELQAQVQKDQAELTLIEQENILSIAHSSLNHVLGFEVDKVIKLIGSFEAEAIDITYENAIELSRTHNPNLIKSQYDLKASKNYIGMAMSSYLPSLSAYAGYSWRHEDFSRINNILDKDYNWYAGVSLSIPIFQGFSRIANVGKAKLNFRYNEEIQTQTQKDIDLELKESYFLMQQSKKKIAVAEVGVESAATNLKLAQEKFRVGSGTMLDITIAQVTNTEAQSNHIQALYEYNLSIARLQKAMGQLKE
ncbi:TolC family protein [bacterium]|nr:TolC family protein [candidate division CSSED10-310 bacterium]